MSNVFQKTRNTKEKKKRCFEGWRGFRPEELLSCHTRCLESFLSQILNFKKHKKEKHKKGKRRVCQKRQDEALQDVFNVNPLDMKSSHYMTWYIVFKI